jgi:hypothetical protein
MNKVRQFVWLYAYAVFKYLTAHNIKPKGLKAVGIGIFNNVYDEDSIPYGIMVFVMPRGESLDNSYEKILFGPFGFTSQISWRGKHLYGLDTWGALNPNDEYDLIQIASNPFLLEISDRHPDQILQLAGVRKIFGRHIWPLNKPERFILPGKSTKK